MNKIIIEVGSTNTKIDIYDGKNVNRLDELTILFKQNYKKNNSIDKEEIKSLIDYILNLNIVKSLRGELLFLMNVYL